MSSQKTPPAPDYSPIAAASREMNAEMMALQREQFAWAKQTYAENKQVTDEVVERFLATQERNDQAAIKDRERYEDVFQPLEDDLARDAQDYASEERKTLERGRAMAQVSQQFQAARTNAQRALEAFGVNPGSTRFQALDLGARMQEAAAKAAAANQSDLMVDATGRALRSEAINIGRGYPGQVAGTYNTALQAGTGAVNSGNATTTTGANTMGTSTQYAGLGNQALNTWTNALNTGYSNSLAQFQADQKSSSGWGSALGLAAGLGLGAMGLPTSSVGGKLLGFEEGGAVDLEGVTTDGGAVPAQVSPSGGKAVDDVPARVSVGEFIIPKDVVEWYGQKHFYALIEKADDARNNAKATTGAVPEMKMARPAAMAANSNKPRRALEAV